MTGISILDGIILRADDAVSDESPIADDLRDKFLRLFPSWQVMLTTIIVIVLLFFILKKLAWKPIKDMYEKRRAYIQKNIDTSEQSIVEANKNREEAKNNLADSKLQADKIIAKAKTDADALRQTEVKAAQIEAARLVEDAKKQIETDKILFEAEKKEAIIDVAIKAASKVVEENLDEEKSKKIINEFLK